jgi:very-short-patch-repair endonuclease
MDFYHEPSKLAVELDGSRYHSEDGARRRDIERDAELAAIGILTIRFSFQDVTERGAWCRRKVLDAVRHRTPL